MTATAATLGAVIKDYLTYQAALGRSTATLVNYRSRLKSFRAFAAANRVRAARNVTIDLVRAFHDDLLQRGLKGTSRSAFMYTLKEFLAWCHERGMLLSDLAPRVELPEIERPLPPTPLAPEEVERLIELVDPRTRVGKRNRAILETLYACGVRAHEVLGLNVGDVDFNEGTVFVRGKGGKDRVVPIHETALLAVAGYLQVRGGRPRKRSPLFVTHWHDGSDRRRLDMQGLKRLFKTLNRKFGKHVHPHLLRHSFAVHLLQNGVDLRYVQALLGHESPDTTSRYLGLVKDDLKRAYDAAIEAILAG